MNTEEEFLEQIIANPDDIFYRAVFADWLEECDSKRAEYVRSTLVEGLPLAEVISYEGNSATCLNLCKVHEDGTKYIHRYTPYDLLRTHNCLARFLCRDYYRFQIGNRCNVRGNDGNYDVFLWNVRVKRCFPHIRYSGNVVEVEV